jgi:ABC-type Na+ transport system ATPase subunit NatA
VSLTDLVKRYGELEAARGTLANPTSGSARVTGYDVRRQRDTVRRNIG